jgi:C4-dicarboxylate-specific signal transduction histidine kinase
MRVLIAEDDLTSRNVLSIVLRHMGYEAIQTNNGHEAFDELVRPNAPRIAIVDWMMPGMDGVELCRKLRAFELVRQPYILMLTTLGDKQHLITALDAGADDYLTKPFDKCELRARLAVAVRTIAADDSLFEENQRLEALVEERAKLLIHADRMATIGVLAAGIAHEINNPATFIAGNIEVMDQCLEILSQHADTKAIQADPRLAMALEELPEIGRAMRKGVTRIEAIIKGLQTYARRSEVEALNPVDVEHCLDESLQMCHSRLKYSMEVVRKRAESPGVVLGSEQQLVQVFVNLIVNAADAMETMPRGKIVIESRAQDNRAVVAIEDFGPGIPQELEQRIFDPFFTTKDVGKGTGLGLSICQSIIQSHNGAIRAEKGRAGGARFVVELPLLVSATQEGEQDVS